MSIALSGKEKLYFLIRRIIDARDITPDGEELAIDPTNELGGYNGREVDLLFRKLEKDGVAEVTQRPNRVANAMLKDMGNYGEMDDGCYHIKLLSGFEGYYLRIQTEPEYQKFTGKKVDFNSADILIADLQSKHKEVLNKTENREFYMLVANYGKLLNDSETAIPVLSQLYEESRVQIKPLQEVWRLFFQSWKEYAADVINIVDKEGIIDTGPLENEIEETRRMLDDPDPPFNGEDFPRYYQDYQQLIWRFDKLGEKSLIAKKHLDNEGHIRLVAEYQKVESEWLRYKGLRDISTWWAHYQISRLAYGVLGSTDEKALYFKDDSEVDKLYKYEFEEIGRNPGYSPVIILRSKFERWVERLHEYLVPRLAVYSAKQNQTIKERYAQELEKIRRDAEENKAEIRRRYKETLEQIKTKPATVYRRGLEKKWDVLQAIWTVYEANSRADGVLVPVERVVIKDRKVEEIDGIVEGLKNLGCFDDWERSGRHYDIQNISHEALVSEFERTKSLYMQLAAEYERQKNMENDKSEGSKFALELRLVGDLLSIDYKNQNNRNVQLTHVSRGSGILIEPLIKVCRNQPDSFKRITKDDIESKFGYGDTEFKKILAGIPKFRKYLSDIGLRGELRKLFFANSPGALFKFRIAITDKEWNGLPELTKQKVVKVLGEMSGKKP